MKKCTYKSLLSYILIWTVLAQGLSCQAGWAYADIGTDSLIKVGEEASGDAASTEATVTTEPIITTEPIVTTEAIATTESPVIPEEAYNVHASNAGEGKVLLSWFVRNQSSTGFYIYRSDNVTGEYKQISTVPNQNMVRVTYTDEGIVPGVTYTYRILPYHLRADGSIITDKYSNTCTYKKEFSAPIVKSVKRSGKKVTLKWSVVSSAGGYEIQRSTGKKYKNIKTVKNGKSKQAVLKNISKNSDSTFRVRAYLNYQGKKIYSGYSNTITVYATGTQKIINKIKRLKKKYPSYKYWNHMGKSNYDSTTVTSIPCRHYLYRFRYCNSYYCPNGVLGLQCYGFAWKMSDLIYGRNAKIKNHKSFAKAKVGDVVRCNNNTHSVIIIEKHDDYVKVGECNIGDTCMIYWGRKMTKKELKGAVYSHRYY